MKSTLITGKLILLTLIASFFFSSCEKEDSDPTENGKNTSLTSRTFTVASWQYSSPYHYADLTVPELTTGNILDAVVVAYFSTDGNTWIAVPYTQYHSPYNYFMAFSTSSGKVRITWFYDTSLSQGDDPNEYYSTKLKYKIVVIPSSQKVLKPNVDYYNYNEVKAAFEIKE